MSDKAGSGRKRFVIPHRAHVRNQVRVFLISVLTGLVAGAAAIGFFFLLEVAAHFCFSEAAGRPAPTPKSETLFERPQDPVERPLIFFMLPMIGGLLAGLIVYTWAPEAEGHGTDSMIDAFHNGKGIIRTRVPFIKALATLCTLGTGGSAGREGPIAQIGAGFGSWLAQRLGLSARERRILLLAGTAGGLGAIFRSPLGGALVSVEVLYKEDFESEALVSSIISSVTGFALFSAVFGYDPIFMIPPMKFRDPRELLFYSFLGLICIPVGAFYVKFFYLLRDKFFRPLPLPPHVKPMLGGFAVSLIGLVYPQVYGAGWGQIQYALMGKLAIGLMAGVALFKILATSFTISSGGSGGVFGPTLFIGGMIGGVVGSLAHDSYPEIVKEPGSFVLVGMAAFFAGVAKAPLGALLMTCEMTRGYDLLAPLLLVSMIAILFTGRWSIYQKQVLNKFHSPAHIGNFTLNVLEDMKVDEVYDRQRNLIPIKDSIGFREFRRLVTSTDENFFPVANEENEIIGVVSLKHNRSAIFHERLDDLVFVRDLALPPYAVTPEDSLYEALAKFLESDLGEILVTDGAEPPCLLGSLTHEELISAYHKEILKRRKMSE